MADKCSICGVAFGRFEKCAPLSETLPNALICDQCRKHQEVVQALGSSTGDAERYEYGVSRRYFERQYSSNFEMDNDVRIAIESLLGITQEEKAIAQAEAEHNAEIEQRIKSELSDFLITTGFKFEGHCISGYHGVVSANYVQGTGLIADTLSTLSDLTGKGSKSLQGCINVAMAHSREELIKSAIRAGGNAVIGADFKPFVFGGNMVGVLATGTVVTVV